MLPAKTQTDPIVEILQLAYRRGLAIRKGQEKESECNNVPFPTEKKPVIKRSGSLAGEPVVNPTNRNGKEGLSTS